MTTAHRRSRFTPRVRSLAGPARHHTGEAARGDAPRRRWRAGARASEGPDLQPRCRTPSRDRSGDRLVDVPRPRNLCRERDRRARYEGLNARILDIAWLLRDSHCNDYPFRSLSLPLLRSLTARAALPQCRKSSCRPVRRANRLPKLEHNVVGYRELGSSTRAATRGLHHDSIDPRFTPISVASKASVATSDVCCCKTECQTGVIIVISRGRKGEEHGMAAEEARTAHAR